MATSDMMKHYREVKKQYPDCIIFYRLGDFYEMFDEDAVEVSSLLELTLTGRSCGEEKRAPMCGVPYHAADDYIAKLVSLGKKVAICEQLTEPTKGKGLVERGVIRIVTGGTVTEDTLFDDHANNYIACVFFDKRFASVAWSDITTGEFCVQQLRFKSGVYDLLSKIEPAEIICNQEFFDEFSALDEARRTLFKNVERYRESAFSNEAAIKAVCSQFAEKDAFKLVPVEYVAAINSAGALVSYLKETQMHALGNISELKYVEEGKYLFLDSSAVRNLEIVASLRDRKKYGSLLWAIDRTKTSGGARRLKSILLNPLLDLSAIEYRQGGVKDLYDNNLARESISETLSSVKDLARLCGRISNGIVNPRNCVDILKTLDAVPALKMSLVGMTSEFIKNTDKNLLDLTELANLIRAMICDNPPVSTKDGGFISDGFDEELDKLRALQSNARSILEEMESRERNRTGIRTLKIGFNKVFGYYIEVSNSFVQQVPYEYVRKQTLVNGERYITEELKKFEEDVLTASERAVKIENSLFDKLKKVLGDNLEKMMTLAKAISSLDVINSFATTAREKNYVCPSMVEKGGALNIVAGRHPVVERSGKFRFIPNDTYLDLGDNSMMIITGPNMAGKSTYMRQVALITLLAHTGSFVPAKEAQIPITDKIFTRVGASDNLLFDQSTFMVEMSEVASILTGATENSLVILDEVGRGTSTFDGLSIAWAVVEYLTVERKVKTLFATHYHELSELENKLEGVKNYKVTVKESNGDIVFLRKIQRGSANKSFGIEVASLAGVPKEVTQNAKRVLKTLEKRDLDLQDITSFNDSDEEEFVQRSFIEEYLLNVDLNNVTPLKAFEILTYLKGKVNGEN